VIENGYIDHMVRHGCWVASLLGLGETVVKPVLTKAKRSGDGALRTLRAMATILSDVSVGRCGNVNSRSCCNIINGYKSRSFTASELALGLFERYCNQKQILIWGGNSRATIRVL
jgi:hypothetical protein